MRSTLFISLHIKPSNWQTSSVLSSVTVQNSYIGLNQTSLSWRNHPMNQPEGVVMMCTQT